MVNGKATIKCLNKPLLFQVEHELTSREITVIRIREAVEVIREVNMKMKLVVVGCILAQHTFTRVRVDGEDSSYGERQRSRLETEKRLIILHYCKAALTRSFLPNEDLSNLNCRWFHLLRKLEHLFIAVLLFWLHGSGPRDVGRHHRVHNGLVWVMYHDPFVPLELALSEHSNGGLDFLFSLAIRLLW